MKFICDQMMGTLAKWLRILGFDVRYMDRETSDDAILEIAIEEKRAIISRDKQLIERAKKRRISVVEIERADLDEQLKIVTSIYPVKDENVLSRCSVCNTSLVEIEKNMIKGKVPPKVFDTHNEFWYCKNCDKVYWRGSHWDRIEERMSRLARTTKSS
jgi:hypothetical protein